LKTIILNVPLLIGSAHHLAGVVVDVDDRVAERLIGQGHARAFTPTDAHGSGTIEGLALAGQGQAVETATRSVARRKAVQLAGKAG
jgi:hypothetical protein